jgi:hypothetical protein
MQNASPEAVLNAFLANMAIAIECRRRTEKAVVVQSLNYGNMDFPACIIDRRGHDREQIVNVNDVWSKLL